MWHFDEDSEYYKHEEPKRFLPSLIDDEFLAEEDRTLPSSKVPKPPTSENRLTHDEDEGSEFRYLERIQMFKSDGQRWPRARHYTYWFTHNVVVHTMLGFFPNQKMVDLHDLTSAWLNQKTPYYMSIKPKVTKRGLWLLHNVVAHIAIGLLPCKFTFQFHDWTARKMGIPGWV